MTERRHTLTIADLDDYEAEHIGQILSAEVPKILTGKIEALARNDDNAGEWYDAHLAWHKAIMKKIKWSYEETDE